MKSPPTTLLCVVTDREGVAAGNLIARDRDANRMRSTLSVVAYYICALRLMKAVPHFGGLSPRTLWFLPRAVLEGLSVDTVEKRTVFFRILRFSPVRNKLQPPHIHACFIWGMENVHVSGGSLTEKQTCTPWSTHTHTLQKCSSRIM